MAKTVTIYVRPEDQDIWRVAGVVFQPSLSAWLANKIREELEALRTKTIGEVLDSSGRTISDLLGETQQ